MRTRLTKIGAFILAMSLCAGHNMTVMATEAKQALQEIIQNHPVMALVYLSDTYPVRSNPSYDAETIITVPSGQQVQILDVMPDAEDNVWTAVCFYYRGEEYKGYIPRYYLACSDEDYLVWEETYDIFKELPITMSLSGAVEYADVSQFPDSYQAALTALKQEHPNWTFVKMNTGLDWNDVVSNEMKWGGNLIPETYPDSMKNGVYGGEWAYVSEDALKYYLDPRNGLTEDHIFQFEQLTFNSSYHTETAVQTLLAETFMTGNVPGRDMSYENVFWSVGQELGISPFHLACRVYQEQGPGTSPLISGTYAGYKGYYNYFNIGASGQTDKEIIESGLERAKQEGWTDGYLSIYGGAQTISTGYILKGQDTLYLQKFDVDDSYDGLYWHQYMQNVCAPRSEACNIKKAYQNAGAINNIFVFRIPVYENMPQTCPYPEDIHKITQVVLTPTATTMLKGTTYTITAAIIPVDATNQSLKWTSSDTAVAKVDGSGTVTAVSEGVAVITAETQDGSGLMASCTITVKEEVPVTKVEFAVKGVINGRAVTFKNELADSVIYYSTTSSNLTIEDKCVKNGETAIFNDFYGTVYARAYSNGVWGNVSRLILKIPRINTPVIFRSGNKVTIKTTTPKCTIYYTTDGSTPSPENGKKISASAGTITVDAETIIGGDGTITANEVTIKAVAVRNCFTNSAVVTLESDGSNHVNQSVGDSTTDKNAVDSSIGVPSFSVKGIIDGRAVTFQSNLPNALIYFSTSSKMSTDGVMVASGGTVNFSDFYGTIYARVYYQGKWSNPARLILRIPVVHTPVITRLGNTVKIVTSTPMSTIYYTTDGSVPSVTNGKKLSNSSGTIDLEPGCVIKAIAVRSCFANSEVAIWRMED